jgi:hypothetical protein
MNVPIAWSAAACAAREPAGIRADARPHRARIHAPQNDLVLQARASFASILGRR